jgi:ankyrin repeat protein
LHLLCENYRHDDLIDIVRCLLEKGANIQLRDLTGATALHRLCQHFPGKNLKEIVEIFIQYEADVSVEGEEGKNALHYLCMNSFGNSHAAVQLLIGQEGVIKNSQAPFFALQQLFKHYRGSEMKEIAQLLISKSEIDLTATDRHQRNILHLLCANYKGENLHPLVSYLLESSIPKFDINSYENLTGRNVLHLLCVNYHGLDLKEIIALFITKGIKVHSKDRSNKTALHLLCQFANHRNLKIDLIKALVDKIKTIKDFIIEAVDANGNNALHHLCGRDFAAEDNVSADDADVLAIVEFLIDNAGINAKFANELNLSGNTAFHLLLKNYHRKDLIDIVRIFIEKGNIDVKQTDGLGRNALDLLCEYYNGPDFSIIEREIIIAANH